MNPLATVTLSLLVWVAPPPAEGAAADPSGPTPASAGSDPDASANSAGADSPAGSESGDGESGGKVTRYSFSGLGIDGELRTPALLQFLSRIGGEFETAGIPHRSFMPELQRTVMEDSL